MQRTLETHRNRVLGTRIGTRSWSRSWILPGLSSEYISFPTENRQSSLIKQVGGRNRYGISASCSLSAVP